MGFIVGVIVGVFAYWWFSHPTEAKNIKTEIKEKLEQHKNQ